MPRILVIDDDELVRGTTEAILERTGHEVTLAVDGKTARASSRGSSATDSPWPRQSSAIA